MQRPDTDTPVTILGAGIVGICTALAVLERGVSVRLIDRAAPGQQTSFGNAGVVSPWSIIPQSMPGTWRAIPKLIAGYGRPLSISAGSVLSMVPWGLQFLRHGSASKVRQTAEAMSHLCAPSIELYRKHLRGTGHENLIRDSIYVHAFRDADRASLQSLDYQIRSEKGANLELIGSDRLTQLEPALSRDFKAAVLIKGQARVLSPGRLGSVLARKAETLGAEIVTADVKTIGARDGEWHIQTDGADYRAERVVIAMGAWSNQILSGLSISLPLMAERGYHIECDNPGIELNNSIMDMDAKFVASSMENGLRIAGQAEFAPVDAPANPRREKLLRRVAKAAFPDLQTEKTSFWMGRRPSFPDSLPVIEHTAAHPGLFLNFGHSHYGLMMAPKSGDLLAQLVCGDVPNVPMTPYQSLRFT